MEPKSLTTFSSVAVFVTVGSAYPSSPTKAGQFIINPYPNLRPFWGTLPLPFTTIWGDRGVEVVINWPDKRVESSTEVQHISGG